MTEYSGERRRTGPVAVLVSRYNELVTGKLLEGAIAAASEAGLADDDVDVVWVPGAFELGAAASELAGSGRYAAVVALGAVIRGDTPHFEYVADSAARALSTVAVQHAMPVAFGVLTVDTMQQALDRAGGSAGNKGREAMESARRWETRISEPPPETPAAR